MSTRRKPQSRGFSLIEMLVSVALFATVMLISMGALLTLVDAARKARSLESVMNNLNISLDGMVRSIRQGTEYHCGSAAVPTNLADAACPGGNPANFAIVSFAPYNATPVTLAQRWAYKFETGRIYKSSNGGAMYEAITAPEVIITDMKFYIAGTSRGDVMQPKVVIVIKGRVGEATARSSSTFYIQATAVQRVLDI